VNPKELVTVASLFFVPVCPVPIPAASLHLAHAAPAPLRLPDETPEPAHPPHGEGSGESPMFVGVVGASGAMSNTANAVMMTPSWEPMSYGRFGFDQTSAPSRHHVTSKVTSATPQRRLPPRVRSSC
jgi:hypothetical protein